MNVNLKVWDNGILREAKVVTPRGQHGRFLDTEGRLFVRLNDGSVRVANQDEQGKVYVDGN